MADPVLTTEREQLQRSRDYLRLMREDVLSLTPMAGDRVSQEYLKAELYHRAEALQDLPDTLCSSAGSTTPLNPKPVNPQPENPKPESPQPESPQPENPKPESPQPESPQSESPKPEYLAMGWLRTG